MMPEHLYPTLDSSPQFKAGLISKIVIQYNCRTQQANNARQVTSVVIITVKQLQQPQVFCDTWGKRDIWSDTAAASGAANARFEAKTH